MRKDQEQVTELSPERRLLRAKLILEEALETIAALGVHVACESGDSLHDQGSLLWDDAGAPNWPDVIDGLCDLKYVTNVCAVEMGVDLEPFEEEVHASNMEKTGGAAREDGKILKPEGWRPPEISVMLDLLQSGWKYDDEVGFGRGFVHDVKARVAVWQDPYGEQPWFCAKDGMMLEGRSFATLAEAREYVRREFGV